MLTTEWTLLSASLCPNSAALTGKVWFSLVSGVCFVAFLGGIAERRHTAAGSRVRSSRTGRDAGRQLVWMVLFNFMSWRCSASADVMIEVKISEQLVPERAKQMSEVTDNHACTSWCRIVMLWIDVAASLRWRAGRPRLDRGLLIKNAQPLRALIHPQLFPAQRCWGLAWRCTALEYLGLWPTRLLTIALPTNLERIQLSERYCTATS